MTIFDNATRRWAAAAAFLATVTMAAATPTKSLEFKFDGKISIDRQLDNNTLVVRYAEASATLVELRINGESVNTRAVSGLKTSGETNFPLDASMLRDGDNDVEIRLYDRTGKLVGKDSIIIRADQQAGGPVFLVSPKVGATLMGAVEIRMGATDSLRDSYVSFFVDQEFRSMLNTPPFVWVWDTTKESNGWHEVEAWAVDSSNQTFKTRRTRVFVNNPGGRTDRQGVVGIQDLVKTAPRVQAVTTTKGLKAPKTTAGKVATRPMTPVAPRLAPNATPVPVKGAADLSTSGMKAARAGQGVSMGLKDLTPTGRRDVVITVTKANPPKVVKVAALPKVSSGKVAPLTPANLGGSVRPVIAKTTAPKEPKRVNQGDVLVAVSAPSRRVFVNPGTLLEAEGRFALAYNGRTVDFDVAPRIVDGVPMSPFRHLIEAAGGTVDWRNMEKTVLAKTEGRPISFTIGNPLARIGAREFRMDRAPFLESGRAIVPVSFFNLALKVNVEYDRETGHVLITSKG